MDEKMRKALLEQTRWLNGVARTVFLEGANAAINYLREQQEPVGYFYHNPIDEAFYEPVHPTSKDGPFVVPLYANPVPESEFKRLREAAREFYNATVASQRHSKGFDAERHVEVSATHPELRDRINAASDALEAALKATKPTPEDSQ